MINKKFITKKCIVCEAMLVIVGVVNNPYCDKCKTIYKEPDLPSEMFAHKELFKSIPASGTSITATPVSTLEDENLSSLFNYWKL